MKSFTRISLLLVCWVFLSANAGCAINAATQIAPFVIEATAKGVNSLNRSYQQSSNHISDVESTQETDSDAKLDWDTDRELCRYAIDYSSGRWFTGNTNSKYQRAITATDRRGLSEEECARVTGWFSEQQLAATYNKLTASKSSRRVQPQHDRATLEDVNLCNRAIKFNSPTWEEEPLRQSDVREAKNRGYSELQCARLTGRFTERQLNPVNDAIVQKSSEEKIHGNLPACSGSPITGNPQDARSWSDCIGTLIAGPSNKYSGDKYTGSYKNGVPHGFGTYYFRAENKHKGLTYSGEYNNGKRHGQGTMIIAAPNYSAGEKYVGKWSNNKLYSP